MKHAANINSRESRKTDENSVKDPELVADILATHVQEQNSNMSLPVLDESLSEAEIDNMVESAALATNFLKAIGHEGRLLILCHLASGEKSVAELEHLLSARQAAVSQQLGRLRLEGLVKPRRDGKAIYYSLTDDRCKRIISVVYDLFCNKD